MPTLNLAAATGPVFFTKSRSQYSHELAETCSLTDGIFPEGKRSTFPFFGYTLPINAPMAEEMLVEKYSDMIREHVERRIFFFFQQLIVCYQTKLHFEAAGAQDQGKSAPSLEMNVGGSVFKVPRAAAHSSVLPLLIAYDNGQWQSYKAQQKPKPEGFVFLKGTDYYRSANATMNMLRCVNEADREIDEKTTDSLLREKGLALVNLASQGNITPDEGLVQFLYEALKEVNRAYLRLHSQRKNLSAKRVLSLYRGFYSEFLAEIQGNSVFLKNFLNLNLDSHTHFNNDQHIILKIRYKAIRDTQLAQSGLLQKIEAVSQEILRILPGKRKPTYFEGVFRTLLVEQARTIEDRQRLEKLLNFSPSSFFVKLRKIASFTETRRILSNPFYLQRITFVALETLHDMRSLRTYETYQRAQSIKDLRGMKKWQQWRLAQEVKKRFCQAAASQSTISRIENRQKLVTPQIAQEFSQVFNIDPGLFMPHFFYD